MSRPRSSACSHAWSALALALAALAGCSSDAPPAGSTSTTVSTARPPTPPATYTTGVFGDTRSAACDSDLTMVETAVESYLALNGGTEVTETQLVQQGVIREESVLHDLGPGGSVIPAPTSGCTR